MNREETIKLLSILKAAYPNSYKGMTKDEANGTISVWTMQFANIPANVVLLAVNKLISKSPFPPAISEVKTKLIDLNYEAWDMLREHKYAAEGYRFSPDEEPVYYGTPLDDKTLRLVKEIIESTNQIVKTGSETKLSDMLQHSGNYYIAEKSGE